MSILGSTRGRAELLVVLFDAVSGIVLLGVKQTIRAIRAVMSEIPTRNHRYTQDPQAMYYSKEPYFLPRFLRRFPSAGLWWRHAR
jgi:hypothetical protein